MKQRRQPRVLVIDDEPAVCLVFEEALESANMEVEIAKSGKEGFARLKASSYDMILVDKNLPEMSGIDLIREIRNAGIDVSIFLITGHASTESALEMLHLAIDGYLKKPFTNIFEVVARIERVIEARSRQGFVGTGGAADHFKKAVALLRAGNISSSTVRLHIVVGNPHVDECDWLVQHMQGPGDEIDVVTRSAEVLERLDSGRPDLLIVDTDFDSHEIFELVSRAAKVSPDTICMVTAKRPSVDMTMRLIDLRVRAVLEKPFEERAFRDKLEPVIRAVREAKALSAKRSISDPS